MRFNEMASVAYASKAISYYSSLSLEYQSILVLSKTIPLFEKTFAKL